MRAKKQTKRLTRQPGPAVKLEVVRNCPEECTEAEETPHSGTEGSRAEVVKTAWGVFGQVKIIA